jgi:glyoxylase-like metal-dependent hydrolase (beta-lactamase superfamily II)
MKRLMVIGTLGIAFAGGVAAQRGNEPPKAAIQKLRDNLYVVTGGGGNTAVFVTSRGVVLVDTKLANWGPLIMEQVRSVTDKPVTTIINTHTHRDHTGSNEYFPASVDIVAHENTKANMQKMDAFAGDRAQFLPDRTFKDRLRLFDGPDRIDLYYFGAGHTNGDAIVVFAADRVAHAGDLFPGKSTPLIDVNNGGSGVAYPETLARAATVISGVDTVIPGHSNPTAWRDFVEYGEFNRAFLGAVQQAIKAGKTPEDAAAGLSLPDRFKAYGMQGATDNVGKIYAELKK